MVAETTDSTVRPDDVVSLTQEGRLMIKTVIAESVALMRAGLLALLAKEPDIEVVADIDRRELVVPAVCRLQPDVVAVDCDMAAHDGFAAIPGVNARGPAFRAALPVRRPPTPPT